MNKDSNKDENPKDLSESDKSKKEESIIDSQSELEQNSNDNKFKKGYVNLRDSFLNVKLTVSIAAIVTASAFIITTVTQIVNHYAGIQNKLIEIETRLEKVYEIEENLKTAIVEIDKLKVEITERKRINDLREKDFSSFVERTNRRLKRAEIK